MKQAIFFALIVLGTVPCRATEHPYILWTREEAASVSNVIATQEWARKRYADMGKDASGKPTPEATFRNLAAYAVMGDRQAGEAEKRNLMAFSNEKPDDKRRYYSPYEQALRYDVLYDMLTAEERAAIEAVFRRFIDFHLKPDNPPFFYNREAFLPNMQWNLVMGTHLMAVALGDEKAIRAMFASTGGWKWYMDEYVADGEFYFEEFGKYYSMVTEMILWCRGLERLGLDELGFGYTGRGGANMRNYLRSILHLTYSRTGNAPRPRYHRVTMGDAGDLHIVVAGYGEDGRGGNGKWSTAHMNGDVPRMLEPFWFEFAEAKWPGEGFDFLLAGMRRPDADRYYPSLFFLRTPVDPEKVRLPPSPSFVASERGFAVLRADESPTYWNGPAPTVAFQFSTYYMHYTSDSFSLLQFIANNRVLYCRRGIARGYGGGCPWTDNVRSQTGVVVDGLRPRAVGTVPSRSGFDPLVKFTAALGKPVKPYPPVPADDSTSDHNQRGCYRAMRGHMGSEIYAGVDLERALFLTREYLFDVYRLSSGRERLYQWQVQVYGQPVAESGREWTQSDDLKSKFYNLDLPDMVGRLTNDPAYYELKNVRRRDAGTEAFTAVFRQGGTNVPPGSGGGVAVHMPAGRETALYCGNIRGPEHTTFIASRQATSTVFVAVHEPYEKDALRVKSVRTLASTLDLVCASVKGEAVDDRVMYRYFGDHMESATVEAEGEKFVFADRAFVRVASDRVDVSGGLRSARIKVKGAPKLFINGVESVAQTTSGVLAFGE